MTARLSQFQDQFARALLVPPSDADPEVAAVVRQPGSAVYRNTVMKGWVDGLQANFPSVARLVGGEWFRAAAGVYAASHRPSDPRMLYYGEDFPEFLARFEPAADLPYLPGVARLDRLWTEAHAAYDEAPLDPAALADLAPEALAATVLKPHNAARWMWFADQPIYTIWHRNRSKLDDNREIAWAGEGALVVRPQAAVAWIALDAAGCAFLDACMAGGPLAVAANATLEVRQDADSRDWLPRCWMSVHLVVPITSMSNHKKGPS